MNKLPFRIGSTSFVYHADILTNVRRLAPLVDDIELVLFNVKDKGNIPSPRLVKALHDIAGDHSISFTVHLPLSIQLGSLNKAVRRRAVSLAKRIINATEGLFPWAYIIHLDARPPYMEKTPDNPVSWSFWQEVCCESLDRLIPLCEKPGHLCVENLESYSIEHVISVVKESSTSLCLDIGHLWLRGMRPVEVIKDNRHFIRVIHLHGIQKRDHVSLIHTDTSELYSILHTLKQGTYKGVVTIEVFSEKDFFTSMDCMKLWAECTHKREGYVWKKN
jgi:sugar phosphate isomerase/epimerase